ncbi:hypothetical protein HK096_003337 [Nowakowskiella sp. JEL0078]|nr:hypothetical protein HK096_003337 [Nowakowskiella sp. JEL0078]
MPKIPTDENAVPEPSTDTLQRIHNSNAILKPSGANSLPVFRKNVGLKPKKTRSANSTPIGLSTKSASLNVLALRDTNQNKKETTLEDEQESFYKEIHKGLNPFSSSPTKQQLRKRSTISPLSDNSNDSDTPLKSPSPAQKHRSISVSNDNEDQILNYAGPINKDPIQRLADAHEIINYLKSELESTELANIALAESQEEGLQKIDKLKEELLASEIKVFALENENLEVMEQSQLFRTSLFKLVQEIEKRDVGFGGVLDEARKLLNDSSVVIVSDE